MAQRKQSKVVLITGASAGIGAGLAREYARRGADLVLAARRLARLEGLADEVQALGGRAVGVACDVTRDGDVERAVQVGLDHFGRLDVVVANAGFGVTGRVTNLTLEDFRRQFETNVFGVLRTVLASADALAARGGTLALMGSVSGHLASPGAAPYCMSKFAVRALAEALRGELRPRGVAVVLLSPGFVDSDIRRTNNQGRVREEAEDPVPAWLRMSTAKACRIMVRAIEGRRAEVVVTSHGKVAVFLSRHFPRLTRFLAGRVSGPPRPKWDV